MRRSPEQLAAMASAAVPLLRPRAVAPEPTDAADFDAAVIGDGTGKHWRVRAPRHAEASLRLENELAVLQIFAPAIRTDLPFELPTVAGSVRQGELTTFVYSHLPGRRVNSEDINGQSPHGRRVAASVGRALAAIHSLPASIVEQADLPVYSANEFRQRRLNELDQAATTSRIPASLLRRWEDALEDVNLWRFAPCVVHGDLAEDQIFIGHNDEVTAVTGWTDLQVGDPATDIAWLLAQNDPEFTDIVLESYSMSLAEPEDGNLMRRAALGAEFAIAQWLVRAVGLGDERLIAEAEQMLADLEHDIEVSGGRELTVPPPPEPEPLAPLASEDSDAGNNDAANAGLDDDADDEMSVPPPPAAPPSVGAGAGSGSSGRSSSRASMSEPEATTTRHPIISSERSAHGSTAVPGHDDDERDDADLDDDRPGR